MKRFITIALCIVIMFTVPVIVHAEEAIPTDMTEETTVAGKWYPAESMEDSPLDADPKQEDVFYD